MAIDGKKNVAGYLGSYGLLSGIKPIDSGVVQSTVINPLLVLFQQVARLNSIKSNTTNNNALNTLELCSKTIREILHHSPQTGVSPLASPKEEELQVAVPTTSAKI